MTEFNNQQKEIISHRGKNIIVSASAGTGKTKSIIQRIIERVINKEASVDELIVMTLTEAAAQEIKDRLINALEEIADQDKEFVDQQIALIPSSNIGTIHAVCNNMVKKYAYILQIDPSSLDNVLNDAETCLYKAKAMQQTLSNVLPYNELVQAFCYKEESTSNLEEIIYSISDCLDSLSDSDKYIEKVKQTYNDLLNKQPNKDFNEALTQYVLDKIHDCKNYLENEVNNLFDYASETAKTAWLNQENDLTTKLESIYQGASQAFDFNTLFNELNPKDFDIPTAKKAEIQDEKAAKKYEAVRKKLKEKKVAPLFEISNKISSMFGYLPIAKTYIDQLLELTNNYRQNYQDIKARNNSIDFNDMQKFAYQILVAQDGIIAKEYQNKIKEIIIDEYQDTNQKVEDIVSLLSNDDNVVRVGDIKQSIYHFINAKPALMKRLINNQRKEHDEVIPLNINYRCSNLIIETSNKIFDCLMNTMTPNTFKDSDCMQAGTDGQKKCNKPIVIYQLNRKDDQNAKASKLDVCNFIIDKILELMKNNNSLNYSDFAVLSRSNQDKYFLKDVFKKRGIPCYCIYSGGFYADSAVSSITSLIRLIVSNDQKSLVSVLTGPIFKMSYDELAQYYFDKQKNIFSQLEETNHDVITLIKKIRILNKYESLQDAIDYIYNYNNWYSNDIDIAQRTNVDDLYNSLVDCTNRCFTVQQLIDYLDIDEENQTRSEASYISPKDEVVKLHTIHKSKGLEFNYVFVLDLEKMNNGFASPISYHDELGLATNITTIPDKIKHDNFYRELIDFTNDKIDVEENLRLLYVAMTRPKEQIFFVTNMKEPIQSTQQISLDALNKYPYYSPLLLLTANTLHLKDDEVHFEVIDDYNDSSTIPTASLKKWKITHYGNPISYYHRKSTTASSTHQRQLYPLDFNGSLADIRGTNMHRAIELLGIKPIQSTDVENLGLSLSSQDIEKIVAFYNNPLTKSFFGKDCLSELPYYNYYDETNGIIDLFVEDDKKNYIIDFKSDKNVDEETLITRYKEQLEAYKQAIVESYPNKEVEMLIYSFELSKYISL